LDIHGDALGIQDNIKSIEIAVTKPMHLETAVCDTLSTTKLMRVASRTWKAEILGAVLSPRTADNEGLACYWMTQYHLLIE
jgi:hypothetical protein